MKFRFILLFIVFIPLSGFSFTHPKLQPLLDRAEYFEFRKEFNSLLLQDSVATNASGLYYLAWNEHLFGNPLTSNSHIRNLFSNFSTTCPDTIKTEMLMLHLQNDFRAFQYRSADSVCNLLISQYSSVMREEERNSVNDFAPLTNGLKNMPAQTMERSGDLDIKYKRDIASLIRIPVSINGVDENFMFDTGANLSTITESQAAKMHVRVTEVTFGVASSSRSSVLSKLGIADELKIGNAIFHNVIFIVLPDKALKFAGGIYKIKGIIGIPVIAALGEITIHKNGHISSPAKAVSQGNLNLGMSGNTPFIELDVYGTAHPYIFDTGAGTTIFNNHFYEYYRNKLTGEKKKTSKVGGAGGIHEVRIITCTQIPYSLNSKGNTLKKGMIQPDSPSSIYEQFYGIAGEDIFMQWEEMTISFVNYSVNVK